MCFLIWTNLRRDWPTTLAALAPMLATFAAEPLLSQRCMCAACGAEWGSGRPAGT